MENILQKYNRLDRFSQKLVEDFIELLTNRQCSQQTPVAKQGKEKPSGQPFSDNLEEPGNTPFNHQAYKKQLLALRPWTSEEVAAFDENLALFKRMTLKEW